MKYVIISIVLFFIGDLYAQSQVIKGIVFLDTNENGIFDGGEATLQNIPISNGRDIVLSNAKGAYSIEYVKGNLIFLLKPSGYISKTNKNNIVQSYFNPQKLGTSTNIDFPLYEHPENDKVKVALLGDVQVDVMDDVYHVGKLVAEELIGNKPDFIIPLGDLSFDNLEIFNPLSQVLGLIGTPVFYVIGNHDLNFKGTEFRDRDLSFETIFGPSYYAFEYGKNLFLVLNDIYPLSNGKYTGKIDEDQLKFIKNLVAIKQQAYESINLAMHIPLEELENKEELIALLQPFKHVFMACGHTHTQYHNYFKRDSLPDIHELVCGAVCGAWWQGAHDIRGIPFSMMNDGTLKGYWLVDIEDEAHTFNYKVSGLDSSKQINIWIPEVNEWDDALNDLNEPYVYANVFAGDENTNVQISFDSGLYLPMEKYLGIAPELKHFYKLQELGRYQGQKLSKNPLPKTLSHHLWRIKIPDSLGKGAHSINVKASNNKLFLNVRGNRVLWI
ncbi:calcineurin-like phosphoesterase C-terminal domain-containing protein [Mariniflexile sp. HMF6888]|uniref:calcineurin-like phosphoesterase C-terminal domain-containing protein n=1 Tax=Mariniflexile sp. HMF6888 TaxID=3373086 RepID=UPI0037AC9778